MGNMWCGGDEGQFAVLAASVSAQIGLPGTPSHRARLPSAPACRRPRGRWVSAGDYTLRGCPDVLAVRASHDDSRCTIRQAILTAGAGSERSSRRVKSEWTAC